MNKYLSFFLIPLVIVLAAPSYLFPEALTGQTLRNDIAYYHKVAGKKKLSLNDKRYILLRIEQKYEGSGIDTSPILAEKEKLKNGASADGEGKTGAAAGTVSGIVVSETKLDSRIHITASGVQRSNYFLLKDPDPSKPPKIILDLYGVTMKLSSAAKSISLKHGIFLHVGAVPFEKAPHNIVRISAQMRSERPYRIKKDATGWLIVAEKEAPEPGAAVQTQAAAPAQAPAPAPAATAKKTDKAINDNYHIEAGDLLGISVYPAEELSRETIVQPDGNISFPLLGSAAAKGQSIKQFQESMTKGLGKYISNPQVTITVRQFSRRQLFAMGEVHSVGSFNYKENLRLMEFISSVGGFTENANRREVKIYRGPAAQRKTFTVNVEDIIRSGDFSKDFLLEPGDIVEVTKGGAKVAILGDVKSPGYYSYKDNMKLLELISLASGFNDTANISRTTIIRPTNDKDKTTVMKADVKKMLSGTQQDFAVQPGDTVYVPKKALASTNWFVTNVMPWLSLAALIVALRGGT